MSVYEDEYEIGGILYIVAILVAMHMTETYSQHDLQFLVQL